MSRQEILDRIREKIKVEKKGQETLDSNSNNIEAATTSDSIDKDLENLFKTNLRISEGSNLTSEDYHKRAEQRKELDWLVFTVMPDSTEAQLDDWLRKNQPSKVNVQDGVGMILVKHVSQKRPGYRYENQLDVCRDSWQQIQTKNQTPEKVVEIAKRCQVTGGKWLIMLAANNPAAVDSIWKKVARGIFKKRFGENVLSAKISAHDETEDRHVICVYTKDFSNYDEIMMVETQLRRMNITCNMTYKPDICSVLGIYRNHAIRPTICTSKFDKRTGTSSIIMAEAYEKLIK